MKDKIMRDRAKKAFMLHSALDLDATNDLIGLLIAEAVAENWTHEKEKKAFKVVGEWFMGERDFKTAIKYFKRKD